MSQNQRPEYVIIQTRESGKDELYSADSLDGLRRYLEEVTGAGHTIHDPYGGDD